MANEDDEAPPLSDLIARQDKEKAEARDLLAGFDRPGRGPKHPRSGDFVAHYSGKHIAKPAPRKDRSREEATFVLPKKQERLGAFVPWLAAAGAMLVLGFLVAFVASRDAATTRTATIPSAATTITSVISAREEVPPPDPSPTAETTEQTIAVPVPAPRPSGSGAAPEASSPKARVHTDDSYLRDY